MRRLNPFVYPLAAAAMLAVACADPPVSPSDVAAPPALQVLGNEWQPFTWYWWACEEPVTVEGKVHVAWSMQQNDNRWQWRSHQNVIGSGVGEFTGRTYQLSESYNATENVAAGWTYPLTISYNDQLKLVGQGSTPDLRGTWQWHVTVNANGETTATVDKWQLACGHGPPPLEGKLIVNVTDDENDGVCTAKHCSLREALIASNSFPGTDTIAFRIPGRGPHTIRPLSGLPEAFDPVVIDGTTEPNFRGTPIVELDGSQAGDANGLLIFGGGSTVRGLVINRFGSSVGSANGIELAWSSDNVIEGNYIGTDVTGTVAMGNSNAGVLVGGTNNRIGGTTAASRNVISGNLEGVTIADPWASGNLVHGNYIGTDASGTAAVGNAVGVLVLAPENFIGGTEPGAGNVISGNEGNAVAISGPDATGNRVYGNLIGTDVTGTAVVGNGGRGVAIDDLASGNFVGTSRPGGRNVLSGNLGGVDIRGAHSNRVFSNYIGTDITGTQPLGNQFSGVFIGANGASHNWIGGTREGSGNVVAFSGQAGVRGGGIVVHSTGGTGNAIRGNSVYANLTLGIDLFPGGVTLNDPGDWDTGPNNLQNFPVLFWAGGPTLEILGELNSTPATEFRIEFFASAECDPSGHGEGERYLGAETVATDLGGNVFFHVTLDQTVPPGTFITATATDPEYNTSEFSACVPTM